MSSIFACDLGLNRKTLSRNFFCCFVFRFREIFFNQHWRQMRASLNLLFGKTNLKLSLERTPPGKKLHFCIRYLWKMKEKPANLNRGVCFSIKWKATSQNWAHLDKEKQFGLKSHLRASCTQPFKNITPLGMNCLARATVTYTRSVLAPNKSSMSEWSIAVEAYLRRWFRWPFFGHLVVNWHHLKPWNL